jgi:uncharacterized protein YceH (UPF0502 family)
MTRVIALRQDCPMELQTATAAPATKSLHLSSRQRRVLGVLIEKAKTTPDAYPMSINGLVTGCNQKSNRDPVMNVTDEQVEETLEELRGLGAVAEVQGSGRVPRYRHYAKEFLGVTGAEVAVIAELLLRGEQSLGDLRARAARMDPIPDQGALKPIVDSLLARGLMIELTPPGRGQIVSHNLYKEREINELRAKYAGHVPVAVNDSDDDAPARPPAASSSGTALPQVSSQPRQQPAALSAGNYVTRDMHNELVVEVAEMRAELARVREMLREIMPQKYPDA